MEVHNNNNNNVGQGNSIYTHRTLPTMIEGVKKHVHQSLVYYYSFVKSSWIPCRRVQSEQYTDRVIYQLDNEEDKFVITSRFSYRVVSDLDKDLPTICELEAQRKWRSGILRKGAEIELTLLDESDNKVPVYAKVATYRQSGSLFLGPRDHPNINPYFYYHFESNLLHPHGTRLPIIPEKQIEKEEYENKCREHEIALVLKLDDQLRKNGKKISRSFIYDNRQYWVINDWAKYLSCYPHAVTDSDLQYFPNYKLLENRCVSVNLWNAHRDNLNKSFDVYYQNCVLDNPSVATEMKHVISGFSCAIFDIVAQNATYLKISISGREICYDADATGICKVPDFTLTNPLWYTHFATQQILTDGDLSYKHMFNFDHRQMRFHSRGFVVLVPSKNIILLYNRDMICVDTYDPEKMSIIPPIGLHFEPFPPLD